MTTTVAETPNGTAAGRWWHLWLGLTAAMAILTMVSWVLRHPLPEGWDETRFIIRMHRDARIFAEDGLVAGVKALLVHYRMREPAFRLVVLPLTALVDPAPLPLRLWSMLQFLAATAFTYTTARLAGGRVAGCVAGGLVLCSPALLATSARVYTDPPLFLAVSASIYFVVRMMMGVGLPWLNVAGLAAFLGLGALAKLTFALLLGPAVLLVGVLAAAGHLPGLRVRRLLLVVGLGGALAAPHYLLNLPRWLEHVRASAGGSWGLAGSGVLQRALTWLGLIGSSVFGRSSAAFAVVLVSLATVRHAREGIRLEPMRRTILMVCLVSGLPLLLAHAAGGSGLSRLAVPALFPLAVACGVLAERLLNGPRWQSLVLASLLVGQSILMAANALVVVRQSVAPWDWDELRREVAVRVDGAPRIGYMGLGTALNTPQLEYPWAMRNEPVTVLRLEGHEGAVSDWTRIDQILNDVDVVVTVPRYQLGYEGGNRYNAELSARLDARPDFDGPVLLRYGTATSGSTVHVFFHVGTSGRD